MLLRKPTQKKFQIIPAGEKWRNIESGLLLGQTFHTFDSLEPSIIAAGYKSFKLI